MSELRAKGLWSQLKKRNVVRVALVYFIVGLVVMWLSRRLLFLPGHFPC